MSKFRLTYDYSKIDFRHPVDRTTLDMDMYNRKFELAEKAFSNPKTHPKVLQKLLQDNTLRVFFKFKIANKPAKLFPYQDLITNDHHKFIIFRAANQIGKSELLDCQAADNLTTDHGHGHNEAICSASLKQATYQMIRIKDRLRSADLFDWSEEKGDVDNMSMLSYDIYDHDKPADPRTGKPPIKYTNRLIVTPAGEGILGFDLHVVNLEEFEFWKDIDLKYFLNQLAEPRTYATKGKIRIYSNPNGEQSYVSDLEELRLPDGSKKYHTYVFNFTDRPGNTETELEIAKLGKTRAEIESTLLAIRTTSDRNFFTPDEIKRSEVVEENPLLKMVGKQTFAFLDIGQTHDQCAFGMGYIDLKEGFNDLKPFTDKSNWAFIELHVCLIHLYPVKYPISRVVGAKSERMDTDGWHQEKSVKQYLDEWTNDEMIPIFGCDVTGNSGISPLFQTLGIDPVDITFSGPNKSAYWTRFKYMMEMGLMKRIKHKDWEHQAKKCVATTSARGYLLINSAGVNSGGAAAKAKMNKIPDDCLDMTAGLIAIADPMNITPSTMEMF